MHWGASGGILKRSFGNCGFVGSLDEREGARPQAKRPMRRLLPGLIQAGAGDCLSSISSGYE